jgi:DHA1 family putative efflux transporter-like MFS transporter
MVKERFVTIVLFATIFIVYLENFIVAPLLEEISSDFNLTVEMTGNLVTVYTLAIGLGALLWGPISNRFNRVEVIMWTMVLFSVSSVLVALVTTKASLFMLRVVGGACAGIIIMNIMGYVADYCSACGKPKNISHMMGQVMSGLFGALVFGIPLGILISSHFGWRFSFYAIAVASLICAYFIGRIDVPSPVNRLVNHHYFSSLVRYFHFLKNAELAKIVLVFFLYQMVATSFGTFSPYWIIAHGYDLNVVAGIYVLTGIVSTFVSIKSGQLVGRYGAKNTVLYSHLIMMTAQLIMVSIVFDIYFVAFVLCVYMASVSARMAPMQAVAVQMVDVEERGRYMGLISLAMQTGSAFGVAMVSGLLSSMGFSSNGGQGFDCVVYLLVGVTAIVTLLSLGLRNV